MRDEELLMALQAGDSRAFDQLCDRHEDDLRDFLVKAGGRPELVYRVLAQLSRCPPNYPVQSFLFEIASRVAEGESV